MVVSVTGATGTLGREVIAALQRAGHTARALGRGAGPARTAHRRPTAPSREEWFRVDLSTGDGLVDALDGAYAVIHAATAPRNPDAVDIGGTLRLLDAARRVSVRHVIFVSIVGVDRIPLKYYRKKRDAEKIVEAADVRYSILRATQFHPFLDAQFRTLARVPFVFAVPRGFQIQSVDAGDVADRIVRAIEEGPRQRLADFGGPEVMSLTSAAEIWTAARGVSKRLMSVPIPGKLAGAFRDGAHTAPNGDRGRITWSEWLRTLNPEP